MVAEQSEETLKYWPMETSIQCTDIWTEKSTRCFDAWAEEGILYFDVGTESIQCTQCFDAGSARQ